VTPPGRGFPSTWAYIFPQSFWILWIFLFLFNHHSWQSTGSFSAQQQSQQSKSSSQTLLTASQLWDLLKSLRYVFFKTLVYILDSIYLRSGLLGVFLQVELGRLRGKPASTVRLPSFTLSCLISFLLKLCLLQTHHPPYLECTSPSWIESCPSLPTRFMAKLERLWSLKQPFLYWATVHWHKDH